MSNIDRDLRNLRDTNELRDKLLHVLQHDTAHREFKKKYFPNGTEVLFKEDTTHALIFDMVLYEIWRNSYADLQRIKINLRLSASSLKIDRVLKVLRENIPDYVFEPIIRQVMRPLITFNQKVTTDQNISSTALRILAKSEGRAGDYRERPDGWIQRTLKTSVFLQDPKQAQYGLATCGRIKEGIAWNAGAFGDGSGIFHHVCRRAGEIQEHQGSALQANGSRIVALCEQPLILGSMSRPRPRLRPPIDKPAAAPRQLLY